MILFANTITPRLRYITEFIGREISGQAIALTSNESEFSSFSGPRLNYSDTQQPVESVWIRPHGLLFEKGVREQDTKIQEWNGHPVLFRDREGEGEGEGFDIFAAAFYLISRYEEWLPHQKDSYGRYAHTNSIAFKANFLGQPLVNTWIQQLKEKIIGRFPYSEKEMTGPSFRFLPTYDIDEAYAFRYKTATRRNGGALRDLVTGKWNRYRLRKKVLANQEPDPYDAYAWMDELHSRYSLNPRYFFLAANKNGKYDRNILPREKGWKELVRRHAEKYEPGLHPSWQSGDDPYLLKEEKRSLEEAAGKNIRTSRQHYIRFTLPQTFRQLIAAGIREDFSMGYGSINGFRASVASPFYWYDLEEEKQTELLLYPFCFMDANSFFEQKQDPRQTLDEMIGYYNRVRSLDGLMITIWHNTFLGTGELFAEWREVYGEFLEKIAD